MKKTIGIILAVLVVLGAGWYLFSVYLVSKLDGGAGSDGEQQWILDKFSTVFENNRIGVHFRYPKTYDFTITNMGTGEREWHAVTLLPKGYVAPEGGEGPAAITVQDIPNPEGLSLEQWIKSDNRSNWKLAAVDASLDSTTVGGNDALAYRHGGLFEFDAVAVAHNGKIYLFEVGWMGAEDQIRTDFAKMLDTVQFL